MYVCVALIGVVTFINIIIHIVIDYYAYCDHIMDDVRYVGIKRMIL